MAINKDKLYKQAIKKAKEKNCYFIEQLVSLLPCAKPTFYQHFPIGSNEMNNIKDILDSNRASTKSKMYTKWFDSENATLQVALMKLIASDNEAHRLNGSKQEVKQSGDLTQNVNLSNLTYEQLKELAGNDKESSTD